MYRILLSCLLAVVSMTMAAQVNLSSVDKAHPNDEVFMDMAVTTASAAQAQGKLPCGAVVILNGAFRSAGMPDDNATAEENAIAKSRRKSLANASIYTVNYPTSAAINAIRRSGADAIYYVNSADEVIASGIYPAEAFDTSAIDDSLPEIPIIQLPYPPAAALLQH